MTYSPEELRDVVGRAAELRRPEPVGLSPADIAQLGEVAGLDPQAMGRAMSEVSARQLRVDVSVQSDMAVATCEVPRVLEAAEVRELTTRLDHEFGGAGQVVAHADAWQWVNKQRQGALVLTIRHLADSTLVRLEHAKTSVAPVGFGAATAAVAAMTLVPMSQLVTRAARDEMTFVATVCSLALGVLTGLFVARARRRRAAKELGNTLEGMLRRLLEATPAQP
jgi:hypothetical protein